MKTGTSVPSGYVQVASGITGSAADGFERQARQVTPLRFLVLITEAGPRGWLDVYADIWVHPDDVETAREILRRPG